jgi:O-antigen ligase
MSFLKEKLPDLCRKLLPALLTLFLLSFIWTKSWSLISGLFYAIMAATLLALNRNTIQSLHKQWSALLFIGWFSLSTLWSPIVTANDVTDVLRYALAMMALLTVFSTPARDKIYWAYLPIAATLPALAAIFYFYHTHPICARLEHFGSKYPVSSAGLYAFFAIISLWAAISSCSKKERVSHILATLILSTALLLTQSRGPCLGFLCGVAALTGTAIIRRFHPSLAQISILLLLFMLTIPQLGATTGTHKKPKTAAEAAHSFVTRGTTHRTAIWKSTLDQMPGHWITGYGLNAPYTWLETDYAAYGIPYPIPHLHSLIFWALFHGGIVGLAITVILAGTAGWKTFRYALASGKTLPLMLIAFGVSCCIFGGNKYLYRPRGEWIIFWIPICYALTCPYPAKTGPSNRDKT